MKNHIKKDKYKLLNPSINDIHNAVLKSLESPYGQFGFSFGLTGNIESKKYTSQFISQGQPCSCKSEEEHNAKREASKKSRPPQPLDLETIKDRIGGNEKYHRLYLKLFCDKIEPKQVGRPPKPKKAGRPSFKSASYNAPLIAALNTKTLYQPSQEKMQKLEKEMITIVCDCLEITETQFQRRCRMLVKRWGDELISLFSSSRLPLPQSLP